MNIVKNGNSFTFINSAEIIQELPLGSYIIKESMFGYYLEKTEETKLPEKVYHNDSMFIDHVLKTWELNDKSIGIALVGRKGLGKSFTAEIISKTVKIPIIKITEAVSPDIVNFLNGISQPHVVLIDEFEKLFAQTKEEEGDKSQEMFLSYLDGSNNSDTKKLFIITSNDNINTFFVNRPSRLRYYKNYEVLDSKVIKEIIEDKLKNKEYLEDLISNVDAGSINIDVLIKIIDEINLHNKPYSSFKDFFNFKIEDPQFAYMLISPTLGKQIVDDYDMSNIVLNCMRSQRPIRNRTFSDYIIYKGEEKHVTMVVSDFLMPENALSKGCVIPCSITILLDRDKGKSIKENAQIQVEMISNRMTY